jgi:hypothetical protein
MLLSRAFIAGLLEYQGLDDLYRIYAVWQRDRTDFNLAYIPATFTITPFHGGNTGSNLVRVANRFSLEGV